MTAPRVRCSASAVYRDQHMAVESWWTVRVPDGTEYDFCAACCVLEFVVLAGVPADVDESRQDGEAA
jgi:hypothetical protein